MNVAVLCQRQTHEFKEVSITIPATSQGMLLDIIANGICGTDIHIWKGETKTNFPTVLGHEFYGRVKYITPQANLHVLNGDVAVGDYVTVVPGIACKQCDYCLALPDQEQYCLNRSVFGLNMYSGGVEFSIGGNSESVFVPDKFYLYKVDKGWPTGYATLLEPVSVSIKASKMALNNSYAVRNRKLSIIIIGLGTIGFFSAMYFKLNGYDVIGVDPVVERRLRAKAFGIETVSSTGEIKFASKVYADIVIEAAGTLEAFGAALAIARKGGCVIELGNFVDTGSTCISPTLICNHELKILGSVLADKTTYGEAAKVLDFFVDRSKDLISIYPFCKIDKAFEDASCARFGLKSVVVMG